MSNTTPEKSRTVRKRWSQFKQPTGRELEAIRERSRSRVDTSDIPPITQADLSSGRARIVKRKPKSPKVSLTLRLDEDVVDAFKAGGEGYQTRINEALRRYLALTTSSSDPKAKLDQIAAMVDELRGRVA